MIFPIALLLYKSDLTKDKKTVSNHTLQDNPSQRPFLKWAGGKYRLLERIKAVLPVGTRLIEPFAGAAALFLNTRYQKYWLNDVNVDLITLYQQLKHQGDQFVEFAETFFCVKNNNDKRYYQLREHFNNCNDANERSAIFLYLNRHSYNGLCRYNQKGKFNAPFGRYKNPRFPRQQLLAFSKKAKRVKFTHKNFIDVMQAAKVGDVIYCDPPYVPLTKTANFTHYSQRIFSQEQQMTLAELAQSLAQKNIPVIISNHNTVFTRQLYKTAILKKFNVPRLISCKGNGRHAVKELLAVYGANHKSA